MPRVDLHTHSIASPDGGLMLEDYRGVLASGRLQMIAITDHDRIDFAVQARAKLGDTIIIGEEITAQEGEIIGLYLHEAIPAGLTARETAQRIREQGGLVYIPHPFETARKGLSLEALDQISQLVDIIETYNGRTLQNRGDLAKKWATAHNLPQASSSDAHGYKGWGNTASVLEQIPTRHTLTTLLATAAQDTTSTGIIGRLYPKFNRLKKRGGHG